MKSQNEQKNQGKSETEPSHGGRAVLQGLKQALSEKQNEPSAEGKILTDALNRGVREEQASRKLQEQTTEGEIWVNALNQAVREEQLSYSDKRGVFNKIYKFILKILFGSVPFFYSFGFTFGAWEDGIITRLLIGCLAMIGSIKILEFAERKLKLNE